MTEQQTIQELKFNELFHAGSCYIVPIYQRNYEWGEPEITQLLWDLADACQHRPNQHYYLGSLVVYRRENHCYEVIDGQQRLTTLNILKSCLNAGEAQRFQAQDRETNLHYEHRDAARQALNNPQSADADAAIAHGFRLMQEALNKMFAATTPTDETPAISLEQFSDFLNQQVIILRTEVPEHTDLNHYFEIMNTRGEQLEKHEILKAHFMQKLSGASEQNLFARIWDACSDMSRFAVAGFASSDLRVRLFGADFNHIPSGFDDMLAKYQNNSGQNLSLKSVGGQDNEAVSLAKLIEASDQISLIQPDTKKSDEGNLAAIIDFPNFLMHVLKVSGLNANARLDDKFLLQDFGYPNSSIDAKELAIALLKCRMLFDRYILKADSRKEAEERWAILTPAKADNNAVYAKNTFGQDGERRKYTKLEMLQSMFHVSFRAPNHKNWLKESLAYLYSQNENEIEQAAYVKFFEKMAAHYYHQQRKSLLTYPAIPYFNLNYVDYLLWNKWHNKALDGWLPPKEKQSEQAANLKKGFDNFVFFQRSSIEHFYPQHPEDESKQLKDADADALDQIGNLCLIGHRSNSRLSNHLPQAKREKVLARLGSGKSAESLNQLVMMMYRDWGVTQIKQHGEKLNNLLKETEKLL